MRSLIHSSRIAIKNPEDYEARSNIMWTATWALNTMLKCGKHQDWMVHMIGQAVGAYTNATHGMTLSAVTLPYYRHLLPHAELKFRHFAENVWGVRGEGKSDREIAEEGLKELEKWMREIGVSLSLAELGVKEDMFEGIANATFIIPNDFHTLTHEEVVEILKESM